MDVREIHGEAGVPLPPAFRLIPGKVGHLFNRGAEASRADHRAVGTREASRGHILPSRMVVIAVEEFFDVSDVHSSSHGLSRANNDLVALGYFIAPGRLVRQ